ncbi:MAG: RNA polymerase sigma factor [Proteobacteria bacterium]|nr:RNA polymerase sigma factor [Pseudomonadota bacterium]
MSAKLVPLRRITGATVELSDEALLAACGTGDTAALGALFDRFHLVVYRFASRLPRTDELARDDLVQSTFLELQRTAHTFRGTSTVKTWILGVAANVARTTMRGEHRRRAHQARFVDDTRDVTPTRVDDQVERRRLMARIGDAIAELDHDHQLAFVLCDLEQVPGVEVAQILGIPEGTLWRRLHTARKAVRAAVEKLERQADPPGGPR